MSFRTRSSYIYLTTILFSSLAFMTAPAFCESVVVATQVRSHSSISSNYPCHIQIHHNLTDSSVAPEDRNDFSIIKIKNTPQDPNYRLCAPFPIPLDDLFMAAFYALKVGHSNFENSYCYLADPENGTLECGYSILNLMVSPAELDNLKTKKILN